jgi:hypothetical protein
LIELLAFALGAVVGGLAFCVGYNCGKTNSMTYPGERRPRLFGFRSPDGGDAK